MIKDNKYIDMAYTVMGMHFFEDGTKNQIKAMLHFAELYNQSEVKKLNEQSIGAELPMRKIEDIAEDYGGLVITDEDYDYLGIKNEELKVVKINKRYRNGSKEHFLVITESSKFSNDDIFSLVEEWCENDSSGAMYGYNFDWEFVEDEKIKESVLKEETKNIELKIERLKKLKYDMEKFLK